MGKQSSVETRFRESVKRGRGDRDWSRADLSKRLQDMGCEHIYPSTVAKIESGERAVRIDEATAIAELFDVSLDILLGRSVKAKADEHYTLRALIDTSAQAAWQVSAIRDSLRNGATELSTFAPTDAATKRLVSECERIADTLADVTDELWEVLRPTKAFSRFGIAI